MIIFLFLLPFIPAQFAPRSWTKIFLDQRTICLDPDSVKKGWRFAGQAVAEAATTTIYTWWKRVARVKYSECEGSEEAGVLSRQSGVITGVITVTAHCCATKREREHCFFLGNRQVYGDRSFAVFSCPDARARESLPRPNNRSFPSLLFSSSSFFLSTSFVPPRQRISPLENRAVFSFIGYHIFRVWSIFIITDNNEFWLIYNSSIFLFLRFWSSLCIRKNDE